MGGNGKYRVRGRLRGQGNPRRDAYNSLRFVLWNLQLRRRYDSPRTEATHCAASRDAVSKGG